MGTEEGGVSVMFARTTSGGAAAAASAVQRPQLQSRRINNLPPNSCVGGGGSGGGSQQCPNPEDPRHHHQGFFRSGHLVGLQRLQHHLNGSTSGFRWGQGIPHHLHHHPPPPHHHHHHNHHHPHMVTPPPEPQQHHWYPWPGPKKESGGGAVGGYVGGGGGGGGGGPQPLGLVGGGAVVGGGGGTPLVGEKPSKEEEEALWSNVEAQAAFLGPNLWDRTLPYDADLKEYVDLDEFLSENGIPVEGEAAAGGEQQTVPRAATASSTPPHQQQQQHLQASEAADAGEDSMTSLHRRASSQSPSPESYDGGDERQYPHPQDDIVKNEHQRGRLLRCSPQPPLTSLTSAGAEDSVGLLSGCVAGPPSPAGSDFSMSSSTTTGHEFDPRTRAFSDEELKPQPMIKKSKKQFVPDDLKDEKYWARRRKNNMAAKRSRDARRVKENQIALRAGFLEKENVNLRQELERLKKENSLLRDRLTKYTEV